ncbi:aspartic proteinase CDR1-like [Silene latifolia]|uniref:aspartic proteinase CDR1-like n=1 Tax=Silene latifolia TaxID=37657 RepID=UPI003D76AB1C
MIENKFKKLRFAFNLRTSWFSCNAVIMEYQITANQYRKSGSFSYQIRALLSCYINIVLDTHLTHFTHTLTFSYILSLAMAASQVHLQFLILFFCYSYIMCSALTFTHKTRHPGFTIDLIHRDSPNSPLHNPAKTRYEHLSEAFSRSTSRATHFTAASRAASAVQASVVPAGGEYLMNISIGTPPVRVLGIADTGSDLTWTQCKPCVQCYEQKLPIFDPKKSSSYNPVPCGSPTCYTNLASRTCDPDGTCSYYYSYGDKSYTNGVLATEVVTFGPNTPPFPGVSIGCGHENDGTFNEKGSGLIGLGGGGLSLIRQLKPSIGAQFSYCLVPYFETTSASKISFGPKASVNGPGAVSTPLVKKDPSTFYYLTLESIGIGNVTLDYKKQSAHYYTEEGNIIIDSGTTLTLLPKEFYDKLEGELEKVIKGERIQDPEGSMGLCYKTKKDLEVPVITARFAGADVQLKAINTFVRVEEDMVCFAMVPASEVAIFGNLAQINFLVGYDLDEGRVSFKPTDCSKHAV